MGIQLHERLLQLIDDWVLATDGSHNILRELHTLTNSEQTVLFLSNWHSGLVMVHESYLGDCGKMEDYETQYTDDSPCRLFIGKIAVGNWYFVL